MLYGRERRLAFIHRGMILNSKSGFQGAKYQSFKTEWAAEQAFKTGPDSFQVYMPSCCQIKY